MAKKYGSCPSCHFQILLEEGKCGHCGKKFSALPDGTLMSEDMVLCVHCGKPNKPDAGLCDYCHKKPDGSDITLDQTPMGAKIDKLLNKVYIVMAVLVVPSIFMSFGLFMAVTCLGIVAVVHMRTIRESKSLKEASDSIFMLSLVFILFGGALTAGLAWIVADAMKAKVDHSAQDQLLAMTGSLFLSGLLGALWASRQGVPNVWKFIKGLYKD